MYKVIVIGGFNSVPLYDLDEAIEYARETNCNCTVINLQNQQVEYRSKDDDFSPFYEEKE